MGVEDDEVRGIDQEGTFQDCAWFDRGSIERAAEELRFLEQAMPLSR